MFPDPRTLSRAGQEEEATPDKGRKREEVVAPAED
jgi:hypothetical protein